MASRQSESLKNISKAFHILENSLDNGNRRVLLETSRTQLILPNPKANNIGTWVKRDNNGVIEGVKGTKRNVNFFLCSDLILITSCENTSMFSICSYPIKPLLIFVPLRGLRVEKTLKSNQMILSYVEKEVLEELRNLTKHETEESHMLRDATGIKTLAISIDPNFLHQLSSAVSSAAQSLKTSESPKKPVRKPPSAPLSPISVAHEVNTKDVFQRMLDWYSDDRTSSKKKAQKRGDIPVDLELTDVKTSKEKDKHLHCIKILDEIMRSEKDYVLDICTLCNEFMKPLLMKSRGSNCEDAVKMIFSNVPSILEVNCELLKALSDGINVVGNRENFPSVESVASIFAKEFLKHMAFLKMYSLYCHQYKQSLQKLEELRNKNAEFESNLTKCEAISQTPGGLQSLLIKPVQRICKYPLLFKELARTMKETEKKRGNDILFSTVVQQIEQTLHGIEQIAATVNDKVQDIENQQLVLQVFHELGGEASASASKGRLREILAPTRRFKSAHEVLLREHSHRNPARRIPCVLYLFNDMVVIGRLNATNSLLGLMGSSMQRRANTFNSGANANSSGFLSVTSASTSGSVKNLNKQRARLLHMFDLMDNKIRVKRPSGVVLYDENKRCAFELLISTSVELENEDEEGKKIVSSVDKFDIWCEDRTTRDLLANEIAQRIIECQKQKTERSERKRTGMRVVNRSELTSPKASSLREQRVAQIQQMRSSSARQECRQTNEEKLKEFRKRRIEKKVIFDVEFGEGMFGVAFQNGFDLEMKKGESDDESERLNGVFVSTVAENGQAQAKGVLVGDQLLQVGNTVLPRQATWKEVFNITKEIPRPISFRFQRSC